MNFRDMGLAEPLLRAVLHEGYTDATPIQSQAIPAVLEGHDVIGIAQTGTGKTAAFALPILQQLISQPPQSKSAVRKIRVLVLASTRELAVQIHESFTNYGAFAGLRIATIYGGVGQQPQVNALRKGVDIVVATPGRLLDLIKQGYVELNGIQTLILDEADRMLDMGFFPAIRRVLEYVPKKRQTLMFSATMKPEIRELANSILRNPVSISIEPRQKTTELVDQSVCLVPQKQKTRLLIELLRAHRPSRAIVFSRTKHGADRIVRHLEKAGFNAEAIHANKSQNKRQRTLDMFKGDNPPVLVATDIAARGIDVDQVSHVYLHDMPTEEETYVHRIGRSGRAGSTGIAVSLCDAEERRMLRSIEKLIGMKIEVLDISGFDIDAEESSEDNSEREDRGQRRTHGRRDRGDRPHDQPSRDRSASRSVHPLLAARTRSERDGVRDVVPERSSTRSETSPPRRSERSAPERRDLGREAERQARSHRPRTDRPVSNLALRQQQRPHVTGSATQKPNVHQAAVTSEFGSGVDLNDFESGAVPARKRRRRRRSTGSGNS